LIEKKKIIKKIIRDMKNKQKRKKLGIKRIIDINQIKDEFIIKLERTFNFSYERDLYYIDDNISLNNQYYSLNIINNPLFEDINEKY
jgi:hypothetical protein